MRLKRTQMGAAGHDEERIRRVLAGEADMVMLDLEDSVIPPFKERAREQVVHALKNMDFKGIVRCVKINGWESGLTVKDLKAVLPAGVDEIKLSKCENPCDVCRLDEWITGLEAQYGIPRGHVEINVQIETPLGIRNAYEVLSASRRVTTASLGQEDLVCAMGVQRDYAEDSLQAVYMTGKLVMDANAAGIRQINATAIVAEKGDFQGTDAYVRRDTERLRRMGFTGRGAVSERHASIINEVFTPDRQEYLCACRIVENWDKGMESGDERCFFTEDGKAMDPGKVERARREIAVYEAYQALLIRKG